MFIEGMKEKNALELSLVVTAEAVCSQSATTFFPDSSQQLFEKLCA